MMDSPVPTDLTPLEDAVLTRLLTGDHPGLAVLRSQLAASSVGRRENSGVGFFTHFEVPPSAPVLRAEERIVLGDVHARMAGLERGAGFLLFIDEGRVSMLEAYTYAEPWPSTEEGFELGYLAETATGADSWSLAPTESRDLVALQRRLGKTD